MFRPTRSLAYSVFTLTGVLLFLAPCDNRLRGADGEKSDMDRYEEKAVSRATERAVKANDSERYRWLRALDGAFSTRVGAGLSEDDVSQWFDLLSPGGKPWRRDAIENKQLTEMFDRVIQRLELGPVPSIRREEFLQYARKAILEEKGQPPKPVDLTADADRVFRVLDRDGSGILERAEWTDELRAASNKADKDGNGRIDAEEYRVYFTARVFAVVDRGPQTKGNDSGKAANTASNRSTTPGQKQLPAGTPSWFTELDANGDGQIALDEWRKDGRSVAEFVAMDLDGDGLLTPAEYQLYLKRPKPADDDDPR